ncbi:MAG: D-cysteine desulfhydrase family protein [Phycisphaerae bacterium]|nr:D-cysteine desulfhydrase family protein [Phycisphaerae bacterium]
MAQHEPRRTPLALLPTPLMKLERLSRELGGADVWMKRDDLTGIEFTGNKVRKLEYVAADAIDAGCDTLVTEGTPQSNHCRATAAVCARLGLRCTLLLRPPAPVQPQGNHLLDVLFGAETRSYERPDFEARRDEIVAEVLEDLRRAGHTGRFTPMGSSEPLGCWGYIRALAELVEQVRDANISACDVVLAISSGGTYCGLLLGKWLHKAAHVNLWPVPVSDDVPHHTRATLDLCRRTIEQYELPVSIDESMVRFIDGYVGEGYAIPYNEDIRAINLLAHTEGIMLDPVYTGKAFAGFLDAVRDGRLGRERPAIFLHTGGVFSDFAWPRLLLGGVGGDE